MKSTIILFDMDNTLCPPTQKIGDSMLDTLYLLKTKGYILGIVSGSDIDKIKNQLLLIENKIFHTSSIIDYMGDSNYTYLINNILFILSTIYYPKKRGNFIENRNGMINVSIIGRNCSIEERNEFYNYDKKYNIRQLLINKLKPLLGMYDLDCSIGGMISIDIYPKGWDKAYCLKLLDETKYNIIFFGDKTEPGGNDFAIYDDPRLYDRHNVKDPLDCENIIKSQYI